MALRENEDAVSAVHRLSGEGKTVAEPGLAGQRKKIEQRHTQEPLEAIENSGKQVAVCRGSTKRFQSLSPCCSCEFVPEARGQCSQDEAYINVSDVVADDQHWTLNATQILAAHNTRPAQHEHRWQQQ